MPPTGDTPEPVRTGLPRGLLPALVDALGPAGVVTAARDVAPYVTDWTGSLHGHAPAVLCPSTTAQVSDAVRLCVEAGVALVPQGGNTGLSGGGVPDTSGTQVVLSVRRMRGVRQVDPVGDTMTLEAGVVLAAAQQLAGAAGRLFPLSLGSEGSCTVGGTISTNAGGTAVLRYGMMRDLVLGLEVVLPDGRVWDGLRVVRKDNTGYDLKQLFIGAEGTLGIVTAAVLRLFPSTPRRATAWVALAQVDDAVGLLSLLRERAGERLTTFELVSGEALDLVLVHLPGARSPFRETHPWHGLVELAAPAGAADLGETLESALGDAVGHGLVLDAVVAAGPVERAALWLLRDGISEAHRMEGPSLKHDVAVPIGDLPAFVSHTGERLRGWLPGIRLVTYGHVGDGNLHYNISGPADADPAELLTRRDEVAGIVYEEVASLGGSVSAEHGLGTTKRDAAAALQGPVERDLALALKHALDPAGLMNPGKVLPTS